MEIISLFSAFHDVQYLVTSSWKKIALIWKPSDECALIPQQNMLHGNLGKEVRFLPQVCLFIFHE